MTPNHPMQRPLSKRAFGRFFAGKPAAVEALIAAKADVNIQTHAGESALRIAKARKLQDIVAMLEKAGAKE